MALSVGVISRMSPVTCQCMCTCVFRAIGGCAPGIRKEQPCVVAFHRVVLRWLVDEGGGGRGVEGEEEVEEGGEGWQSPDEQGGDGRGTQPAEERSKGTREEEGGLWGFNEPI